MTDDLDEIDRKIEKLREKDPADSDGKRAQLYLEKYAAQKRQFEQSLKRRAKAKP